MEGINVEAVFGDASPGRATIEKHLPESLGGGGISGKGQGTADDGNGLLVSLGTDGGGEGDDIVWLPRQNIIMNRDRNRDRARWRCGCHLLQAGK